MDFLFAIRPLGLGCVVASTIFAFGSMFRASGQMPGSPPGQGGQGIPNQTQMGNVGGGLTDQLYVGTVGAREEREQQAAYAAFLKETDPAKKIQIGNAFLRNYPKSQYVEPVDFGMMNAYRAQKDWPNAYRFADAALALQPNDVDVLATVGWTIPHVTNPSEPDANQQLAKAETYAKRAIEALAKLSKPRDLTDAQFADAKTKRAFQAHSALGLVYFRRDHYDDSAKELAQATTDNPAPDPTDLFILGVDLQNVKRDGEAADAFRACSQIAGALQERCKQSADAAKARAEQSKTK
jgi:tetratricopeptide (TPR) repeat protein